MAKKYEIHPKLKSIVKRFTPLLVVFVLIVGLFPFSVSAAETYHTSFSIGDEPFYLSDSASDVAPKVIVQVLSDGFRVLDYSSSVILARYTYSGSDVFSGISVSQDNGYSDGVNGDYFVDDYFFCGGVAHTCDFTLSILTNTSGGSSDSDIPYTHTFYLDGVVVFRDGSNGRSPNVTVSCSQNSVSFTGPNLTLSVDVDGDDFLGVSILKTDTIPLISVGSSSAFSGYSGKSKTTYLYTIRSSSSTVGYKTNVYVDGSLKFTASAEDHAPLLDLSARSTGHLVVKTEDSGTKLFAVEAPGAGYELLGISLSSGSTVPDYFCDQSYYVGGTASDVNVYLYSVWSQSSSSSRTVSAGTWLANFEVSACPTGLAGQDVPFVFSTSSSLASSVSSVRWSSSGEAFLYTDDVHGSVRVYYYKNSVGATGWSDAPYRLITISDDQTVPAAFYEWFVSNFSLVSVTDTVTSQISGSLYHYSERVQIYGNTIIGAYTLSFSFDGETVVVKALQDGTTVWTENLSIGEEYTYVTLLFNAGDGVSTIYLSPDATYTSDLLACDCNFTVSFGEYSSGDYVSGDYADYSGFGSFVVTVLGGFLSFSILPGVTFGGLLAICLIVSIIKLFFGA